MRGDCLSYAADATVRAAMLPWQLRHVLRNPDMPQKDIAVVCLKYAAVEATSVVVRLLATSVGVLSDWVQRCVCDVPHMTHLSKFIL